MPVKSWRATCHAPKLMGTDKIPPIARTARLPTCSASCWRSAMARAARREADGAGRRQAHAPGNDRRRRYVGSLYRIRARNFVRRARVAAERHFEVVQEAQRARAAVAIFMSIEERVLLGHDEFRRGCPCLGRTRRWPATRKSSFPGNTCRRYRPGAGRARCRSTAPRSATRSRPQNADDPFTAATARPFRALRSICRGTVEPARFVDPVRHEEHRRVMVSKLPLDDRQTDSDGAGDAKSCHFSYRTRRCRVKPAARTLAATSEHWLVRGNYFDAGKNFDEATNDFAGGGVITTSARATDLQDSAPWEKHVLEQVPEGRDHLSVSATFGDEALLGRRTPDYTSRSRAPRNGGDRAQACRPRPRWQVRTQGRPRRPAARAARARHRTRQGRPHRSRRRRSNYSEARCRSSASPASSIRSGRITSMGIQCALCHSTVDDSFATGIGHRRRRLGRTAISNVGAIVALAPRLDSVATLLGADVATVRAVLEFLGSGPLRRVAVRRRQGVSSRRQIRVRPDSARVRPRRA